VRSHSASAERTKIGGEEFGRSTVAVIAIADLIVARRGTGTLFAGN
jgi:hypothetical protein